MQVQRLSYGIKGFVRITDYAIRWLRMVTEKAKQKAKILSFWQAHGLKATIDAFGVKRRTLFGWKQQQRLSGGKLEGLNEKSKRPKKIRTREWPLEIKQEIKKLREIHPNLDKEKVHVFLKKFCEGKNLKCPSVSTIGNLIRDMGGLRTKPIKISHFGRIKERKRAKKDRKPKGFKALHIGHCVSLDTIEKHIHGCRRYVITFTDVYSRFSLAWATSSHGSQAAKEFFELTKFLFPFKFEHVLTDNGSEFAKHFDQELKRQHLIHWHTYPKTPKMNAHAERFNRTIQEEFIDYHESALLEPARFNAILMKHLLWHNAERPHHSLNLMSPIQFINTNSSKKCNMYLTNTTL